MNYYVTVLGLAWLGLTWRIHKHTDALLNALKGTSLWLTLSHKEDVSHTYLPLRPLQAITLCSWFIDRNPFMSY